MFIGHFAVAFAAKPLVPRTSLGTLVLAAQLLDLIWPMLVLVGIETVRIEPQANPFLKLRFVHYPWTHSLLLALAWAVAFALLYRGLTGYGRGAATCSALVFPSVTAVASGALAMWLFVAWAAWFDRNRASRLPGPAPASAEL